MKRPAAADAPIVIGDLPDDGIPVLFDGPPMDLPPGATLNADGSVTLALQHPFTLQFKPIGSDQVAREEPFDFLIFRRLGGADVRKMIGAKNAADMALALCTGLGPAKLSLVQKLMDAADEGAASEVVSELLGGLKAGLPPHAEDTPDGIVLPLFKPATDEQGTAFSSLTFKRLTAERRRAAADAPNLLDWGISWATGLSPKAAKSLVDDMDGADAMGVNLVILFLCGSGRRTGR